MASNLTPLDTSKTIRHPGRRGLEIWEAFSADGQYAYIRFEDEGTTWQVKHLPTGFLFPDFFGSLGAARKWTASDDAKARVLALTAPVESAEFHGVSGLSILKATGMSVADASSGEEITQRIMATGYPAAMAGAVRAMQQFADAMSAILAVERDYGSSSEASGDCVRCGTPFIGDAVPVDPHAPGKGWLGPCCAEPDVPECDYCGPGRPCRCEVDSTDPIENIYED